MDIEHLGYKTIDLLLELDLISDPADIFTFDTSQLLDVEGWGEISVGNLAEGATLDDVHLASAEVITGGLIELGTSPTATSLPWPGSWGSPPRKCTRWPPSTTISTW